MFDREALSLIIFIICSILFLKLLIIFVFLRPRNLLSFLRNLSGQYEFELRDDPATPEDEADLRTHQHWVMLALKSLDWALNIVMTIIFVIAEFNGISWLIGKDPRDSSFFLGGLNRRDLSEILILRGSPLDYLYRFRCR